MNDYLSQSLTDSGQLKPGTVGASQVTDGSITEAKLDSPTQAKLNTAGSGNVADDTISTSKLQNSAVTNIKLAADAVTDSKVATGAAIAQSKIANLTSDLSGKAAVSHTHTASQISDATTTGRNVLVATDAAAARSAIGAGTSNLAIGTTASTAKAGNYTPTKADVGLDNVDNTADSAKPVSSATQTALNTKADASAVATALSGKANTSHSHAVADVTGLQTALDGKQAAGSYAATNDARFTDTRTPTDNTVSTAKLQDNAVTSAKLANASVTDSKLAAGTANSGQFLSYNGSDMIWTTVSSTTVSDASAIAKGIIQLTGDLAGTAGTPTVAKINGVTLPSTAPTNGQVLTATSGTATDWSTPVSAPVTSVAGKTGVVSLVKGDVGLANVDNTADTAKPVSTATQTALNAKLDASQKGAVSGVASLDTNTRVPTAQLGTGTANATSFLRGDGSWQTPATTTVTAANITDATTVGRNVLTAVDAAAARTAIGAGTSNLAIGSTSTTAKAGDYAPTKADVGLGNVDNTSDLGKPISTATQTALDAKATKMTVSQFQVPIRTLSGSGEPTGSQGISSSATASTLALRNGSGILTAANGVTGTDVVNKSQLDTKADTAHTHTTSQVTDFATAADARVNALVVAATDTVSGKVELANATEAQAMTDTVRAITPANLADASTSASTASRLMRRDVNGRAQVENPAIAKDIANKVYVDTIVAATPVIFEHGANAAAIRPVTTASVWWVGTVSPSYWIDGDAWMDTTGSSGGSGPTMPADLVADFYVTDITGADLSTVTTWNSRTGSKTFTATGTPTLHTTDRNIEFNGTNSYMDAAITSANPETVILVYQLPATVASVPILGSTGSTHTVSVTTSSKLQTNAGVSLPTVANAPATSWLFSAHVFDGVNSRVRVGDTDVTGNAGTNARSSARLATNSGATVFGNIKVKSVLFFSRALTYAEISNVKTILQTEFGMTL